MASVLVFCDSKGGKFKPAAKEACSGAKIIAEGLGADVTAVNLGEAVSDAAALGAVGVKKVIQASAPELAVYSTEGWAQAAAEIIQAESPAAVVFSANARGRDLSARTAARVGRPLLADCTELKIDGGSICARRPMYAGKVLMWCRVTGGFPVISLRPKAFLVQEADGGAAEVEERAVTVDASRIRGKVVEEKLQEGGAVDVTEADVIVAGGRGMKAPENFELIEKLAKTLGASVGASRAVVDAGWRPHSEQVGQTGKVVSPTLYVAAGISGAIQHLAGMNTSRVIVAVNRDADAPIFKVATYGIVGDAMQILPKLTEEIEKLKAAG